MKDFFLFENVFTGNRSERAAWRRLLTAAARKRKPLFLFLGGPGNSGKSSWALELAHRLGVRNFVQTDTIRAVLRRDTKRGQAPALHLPSYGCWKAVSNVYDERSLVQGFKRQCEYVLRGIEAIVRDAEDYGKFTLIEGLHIVPSMMSKFSRSNPHALPFLMDVPDREIHYGLFGKRFRSTYLNRRASKYEGVFDQYRVLRDYLVEDARRSGVTVIPNRGSARETLSTMMRAVFKKIEEVV